MREVTCSDEEDSKVCVFSPLRFGPIKTNSNPSAISLFVRKMKVADTEHADERQVNGQDLVHFQTNSDAV